MIGSRLFKLSEWRRRKREVEEEGRAIEAREKLERRRLEERRSAAS